MPQRESLERAEFCLECAKLLDDRSELLADGREVILDAQGKPGIFGAGDQTVREHSDAVARSGLWLRFQG